MKNKLIMISIILIYIRLLFVQCGGLIYEMGNSGDRNDRRKVCRDQKIRHAAKVKRITRAACPFYYAVFCIDAGL